ncbi:RNA 2'-phosphotransferase [Massilimicrobiota timonensis]|uniref:RNA 2'-phosphotransferase n=1 Tax=Bacillota TaxID=1239 RepID=UPI001BACB794|nr:RNA 2'-phosphotransferase [Clostridium sp. C1]QUN14139.1 RNA 2'-phosphotransferase [Clostridium sp. C1]
MKTTNISRYIALLLRHHPEKAGLCLDEHGWVEVEALIQGVRRRYPEFNRAVLDEIVARDSKQRYAYNQDKTCIRANQGHSIPVDVELKQALPPTILYHGTGEKYVESIQKVGLIPKSRLYVHLSTDIQTAIQVGKRHGQPVVYQIDTQQMIHDGFIFYISANHIWLTKAVPVQYLKIIETNPV